MEQFLFSWKSHIMIELPWMLPLFMIVLSVMLSAITWTRKR